MKTLTLTTSIPITGILISDQILKINPPHAVYVSAWGGSFIRILRLLLIFLIILQIFVKEIEEYPLP